MLQKKCRCLEIDYQDEDNNEPIVYHGYTLSSKLIIADFIKTDIKLLRLLIFPMGEYQKTDNNYVHNTKLNVPCIVIKEEDAELLINQLENNNELQLQITFTKKKFEKLDIKLFLNLPSLKTNYLLKRITIEKSILKNNQTEFYPIYNIYECQQCKEQQFQSYALDCIQNGRFCTSDPDRQNRVPLPKQYMVSTGENIIQEIIRRKQ
ncbi:hypothetical protein IMG5_146810 [Ichthyophthirius multifiliis]|uniref:Uncharacterized protein n=1 Tax=Ichthyophthirius multifiliis TaxID=5932 RepID=G0QY30_ICHMU|nr:hypothetical protein IMG5_146810 [Ichthyophthirius multifiliis]EGR29874.1 hypothetical protein IMG5_146810 [Ichthyophthirius multifiliis]|eukprot:XP_004031110.1 hypothetical protein IMG5_146810 [Ichthyophthirius multifiliis]